MSPTDGSELNPSRLTSPKCLHLHGHQQVSDQPIGPLTALLFLYRVIPPRALILRELHHTPLASQTRALPLDLSQSRIHAQCLYACPTLEMAVGLPMWATAAAAQS